MNEGNRIKAVKTTANIVQTLLNTGPAGVTEVADHLNLPKSTTHDHLQTLTNVGYVVQEGGKYRLGTQLLLIGESVRQKMPIYQTAKAEMEFLAGETGEHISLMIEEEGKGVLIYTAQGDNARNLAIKPTFAGVETELHTTAPGKAILANLPERRRDEILDRELPRITSNTITDENDLRAACETIREQGFALDDQERIEGMCGIGVPIFRQHATVAGAISIYAPNQRVTSEQFQEEFPNLLKEYGNVIEVNLNYG